MAQCHLPRFILVHWVISAAVHITDRKLMSLSQCIKLIRAFWWHVLRGKYSRLWTIIHTFHFSQQKLTECYIICQFTNENLSKYHSSQQTTLWVLWCFELCISKHVHVQEITTLTRVITMSKLQQLSLHGNNFRSKMMINNNQDYCTVRPHEPRWFCTINNL